MQYTQISDISSQNEKLSFWQSSLWQKILLESNQAKEVFYFGNIKSTFLLVEIRSIGFGFFGAFCLGVKSSQVGVDFKEFFISLQDFLKTKKVLFVQIEPIENLENMPAGKNPLKKFITPYTRCIDLTQSEDEILANMHSKGRYNVRLSGRRGVEIRELENNQKNIDTFFELLQETTVRDNFARNKKEYYKNFLKVLGKKGRFLGAFFEDKMIAGGIFVFYNNRAIYYYGASTSDHNARKQRAPHLLQWTAIQDAKKSGMEIYDFLGIADPNNPKDSLAGVSGFKEQFGGYIEKLPQKYLYPISKFQFSLYSLVRGVRQFFKKYL